MFGERSRSMSNARPINSIMGPSRVNDYLKRKGDLADEILRLVTPTLAAIISSMRDAAVKYVQKDKFAFGVLHDTLAEVFAKKTPNAKSRRLLAQDLEPIRERARDYGIFLRPLKSFL
jgi:hypothetical protein